MSYQKKYFTTEELAKYLGVAKSTLLLYRSEGTGPDYIKIGRLVRYNIENVEAWLYQKNKKSKTE